MEVDQLCEALLLHVEYGRAAPQQLQGSAVEYYHQARDKVYMEKAGLVCGSDTSTTHRTCVNGAEGNASGGKEDTAREEGSCGV